MNLVILYPDYLFRGTLYNSTTARTGFPAVNVITGNRQDYYKRNTAGASVVFDADVSMLPESERACQYLYVGGFNLPVATIGSASAICEGASNTAISTAVTSFTGADLDRSDLMGIGREDIVIENPDPQARNYWRATISRGSASGDHIFDIRKVMMGRWWYPEVEPSAPFRISESGRWGRRNRRSISLQWKSISNQQLHLFLDRIADHKDYHHLALYTRLYHSVLNNERVFNCKLESFGVERVVHNKNNLTATFSELI